MLVSSGEGASGEWTRRLLHEIFGLTGSALNITNFVVRKTGHVVYYGTLTLLLASSLRALWVSCAVRAIVYAGVLALLTSIFDETRQALVPGRTGTPLDVLYDSAGIVIAGWLYLRMSQPAGCRRSE